MKRIKKILITIIIVLVTFYESFITNSTYISLGIQSEIFRDDLVAGCIITIIFTIINTIILSKVIKKYITKSDMNWMSLIIINLLSIIALIALSFGIDEIVGRFLYDIIIDSLCFFSIISNIFIVIINLFIALSILGIYHLKKKFLIKNIVNILINVFSLVYIYDILFLYDLKKYWIGLIIFGFLVDFVNYVDIKFFKKTLNIDNYEIDLDTDSLNSKKQKKIYTNSVFKKIITISLCNFIILHTLINFFLLNRNIKFDTVSVIYFEPRTEENVNQKAKTIGQINNMEELNKLIQRFRSYYTNEPYNSMPLPENLEDSIWQKLNKYNINDEFFDNHTIFYMFYYHSYQISGVKKVKYDILSKKIKFIRQDEHPSVYPDEELGSSLCFYIVKGKYHSVSAEVQVKDFIF